LFELKTDFIATSGTRCILTVKISGSNVAFDAAWLRDSTEADRAELEAYLRKELDDYSPNLSSHVIEDDESRARATSNFLRSAKL
jgi:hypothetical protein